MASGLRTKVATAFLLLTALSCSRPFERFSFEYAPSRGDRAGYAYRFEMALDDPGAVYAADIACRYDAGKMCGDSIRFEVELLSPGGEVYGEIFDYPLTDGESVSMRRHFGARRDISRPWRGGISTVDTGVWRISLRPVVDSQAENILGVGLSYRMLQDGETLPETALESDNETAPDGTDSDAARVREEAGPKKQN